MTSPRRDFRFIGPNSPKAIQGFRRTLRNRPIGSIIFAMRAHRSRCMYILTRTRTRSHTGHSAAGARMSVSTPNGPLPRAPRMAARSPQSLPGSNEVSIGTISGPMTHTIMGRISNILLSMTILSTLGAICAKAPRPLARTSLVSLMVLFAA